MRYERQELLEDATMIPTGEFGDVEADKIIIAIGHRPGPEVSKDMGIDTTEQGYIITNETPYYGMTSREGVFAAGDIVHKPATVVLAMREGKRAAVGINAYLTAKKEAEV